MQNLEYIKYWEFFSNFKFNYNQKGTKLSEYFKDLLCKNTAQYQHQGIQL